MLGTSNQHSYRSITEVVRYSFYALNLFKIDVPPLTFLRYTMFLALYPLGVLGEVVTVFSAVPHLKVRVVLVRLFWFCYFILVPWMCSILGYCCRRS